MPITIAPIALWRIAESVLTTLFALFGKPEALAAALIMPRDEHKLICAWLRTAEAILRRLIFIEARAYPKPNTPPPVAKSPKPRAMRRLDHARTFKLDATFRIVVEPRAKRARRTRRTPRETSQSDYVSVGGVAGRFEALVRAFNDPAAHAKRLARRLYAEPKRVFVFLRWLKPIGHARGEDWDAAEDGAQALSVAHFANTS